MKGKVHKRRSIQKKANCWFYTRVFNKTGVNSALILPQKNVGEAKFSLHEGFKAPANEETLLRKHCCFPKCFPVCADRKHLLRKHFLLPKNKNCF